MSILKVAHMGNPILRAKARPLDRADLRTAAIQKLIDDMIDTMIEYHGVGLAAPQVHEGLRLFVASLDGDGDDEGESEPVVIINPEITPVGDDPVEGWEGCLSIPDIRGRVPRAKEISVRALDRHGDRFELQAHDFPARVIQHETDHLDGILFFDRMRAFDSLTFVEEYARYWAKADCDFVAPPSAAPPAFAPARLPSDRRTKWLRR
jgi:peptide deformylase